ncbi:MAG: sigma-70 family RNA polymerase sigma factor, partial [Legionellales bacterium]
EQAEFKKYQDYCANKFAYLVNIKAAKYRRFANHPDLEQDGFEALILAFNTFDPNKGSFSWWADKYISTRISRAANTHSTIRFPIKKAKELKPYKTNTMPIMMDERPDPLSLAEKDEKHSAIEGAVNSLSDPHRSIINMTYGFNGVRERTVRAVLKDLDITRQQYAKLLREAKAQIKQQLMVLK